MGTVVTSTFGREGEHLPNSTLKTWRGGVAQAIGRTLHEEIVYGENEVPLSSDRLGWLVRRGRG